VSLKRGLLSLVCTTEELLERKSRGSGLEILEYDRRGSLWSEFLAADPEIRVQFLALKDFLK
jgi:hypothetical protein